MEEFYGVRHEAAVGQPLDALFDAQIVADDPGPAAGDGRGHGALPHPDGDAARAAAAAAGEPRRDAAPRLARATSSARIVIVEDISTRVQLEEQLQISEKMASIGLLAAGVAHEVNTPLTGISSFTQMLLETAPTRRSRRRRCSRRSSGRPSARRRSSTAC